MAASIPSYLHEAAGAAVAKAIDERGAADSPSSRRLPVSPISSFGLPSRDGSSSRDRNGNPGGRSLSRSRASQSPTRGATRGSAPPRTWSGSSTSGEGRRGWSATLDVDDGRALLVQEQARGEIGGESASSASHRFTSVKGSVTVPMPHLASIDYR